MNHILPFVVPLLLVALVLRRTMRSRVVSVQRMWIGPAIILVLTCVTLTESRMPGAIAVAAFAGAAILGIGVGYLRARHQELSIDPATGAVTSKPTLIGMALILGLFVIRYGLHFAFPQTAEHPGGHAAADAIAWANGALIFASAMLVTQAVVLWLRTQPLLAEHAARGAPPTGPQ